MRGHARDISFPLVRLLGPKIYCTWEFHVNPFPAYAEREETMGQK